MLKYKLSIRMPLLRMNCGHLLKKALHHCLPEELEAGDCWIALSLAQLSGLILSGAQRADLTSEPWTWKDIAVYPTLC